MSNETEGRLVLGWREWIALPELGLDKVKCKADTGARTSTLHAFFVEPFEQDGRKRARFGVHPIQNRTDVAVECVADIADERQVSDSGGHREQRIVIRTPIVIQDQTWAIELTLTSRDSMRFRMLLGRTAMLERFVVDPAASFLTGRPSQTPAKRHAARPGKQ